VRSMMDTRKARHPPGAVSARRRAPANPFGHRNRETWLRDPYAIYAARSAAEATWRRRSGARSPAATGTPFTPRWNASSTPSRRTAARCDGTSAPPGTRGVRRSRRHGGGPRALTPRFERARRAGSSPMSEGAAIRSPRALSR
jgi:hypothetical protein